MEVNSLALCHIVCVLELQALYLALRLGRGLNHMPRCLQQRGLLTNAPTQQHRDITLSFGTFQSPGILGDTAAGHSLVQRKEPGRPFQDTFTI